jgi:hypothetical protein
VPAYYQKNLKKFSLKTGVINNPNSGGKFGEQNVWETSPV